MRVVTVRIGLCISCADRKDARSSRQKSIAAGDLAWIFACCCEQSEQEQLRSLATIRHYHTCPSNPKTLPYQE